MSGITGIVLKDRLRNPDKNRLNTSLERMLQALVYKPSQLSGKYTDDHIFFANAIPVSFKNNDHFVKEENLPYHIIVDGLLYVEDNEKSKLEKRYKTEPLKDDYQYLPFLYDCYKNDFLLHVTGWFNLFIYNEQTNESLLANDRLGYLPLYYFENQDYFLFASRIESLLASGLIPDMSFDEVTFAEHLFFHYPLSDHTYIKEIHTLPDAFCLAFHTGRIDGNRYWQVSEFFGVPSLGKKEGVEAIDNALQKALKKPFEKTDRPVNYSLTGGWDSRMVLAYILQQYQSLLNTYSFGAPGSDDIRIPEMIASKEGFHYTPYQLDGEYLDNYFLPCAKETIRFSNGTRNYKRTHYLYAIKQVSEVSDLLITGIYGDEVLKVGKPQGGTVISPHSVSLIESGFNAGLIKEVFKASAIPGLFHVPAKMLSDQLASRLSLIKERFTAYETKGQQYFAFRFLLNLRKYFGNEVNSYNDFVYCYSPFIDYDFLKAFAETSYMASRYSFKKPSLILKAQSSRLYYKLTDLHSHSLPLYPSSRGFSMKESITLLGNIKILYAKLIKKRLQKPVDGFNTKVTDQIINSFIKNNNLLDENPIFRVEKPKSAKEDFYSLIYWINLVKNKYLK